MTDPSRILREIADAAATPEQRDRILQFAAELELQHNKQNNLWQVALGNAELGWDNRLEAMRAEFDARFDIADAQRLQILKMLEDLQAELHRLAGNGNDQPSTA